MLIYCVMIATVKSMNISIDTHSCHLCFCMMRTHKTVLMKSEVNSAM